MLEMAAVSFHKVRLHYYVSKKMMRAKWLNYLLERPSRLFGTALLAINVALQVGSEASRRFYSALHINPDFAPITQVFLVVLLAELAPIFAARRYAEHVLMLGTPLLYATARVMTPFVWFMGMLSKGVNRIFGGQSEDSYLDLSRDELQRVLESPEGEQGVHGAPPLGQPGAQDDISLMVSNIFTLRNKVAKQVMIPLESATTIPSYHTVEQLRAVFAKSPHSFLPIYQRAPTNIVGIASLRDLLRLSNNKRVKDYARAPWFVAQNTPILTILKQFRHNSQSVAVVLNDQGLAVGILTLRDLLDEIFGEAEPLIPALLATDAKPARLIKLTLDGEMLISEFNQRFDSHLEAEYPEETLAELFKRSLGHHPTQGETVRIMPFEFTCEEPSRHGAKSILVETLE